MYGTRISVGFSIEEVEKKTIAALEKEGFSVLTKIDVKAVLKKKIDVDRKSYIILGVCNPRFADKALQVQPDLGLLLPSNIVIREEIDGSTTVAFVDPTAMFSVIGKLEMQEIAKDIRASFKRIMVAIKAKPTKSFKSERKLLPGFLHHPASIQSYSQEV